MGKASRDKGARGEREAAAVLRRLGLFPNAQRAYHQSRDGGDAADLEGTGALWVEVKRGKRPNIPKAWSQAAEESAGADQVPVAMTRQDRGRWLVTVAVEDLKVLAMEVWAHDEEG